MDTFDNSWLKVANEKRVKFAECLGRLISKAEMTTNTFSWLLNLASEMYILRKLIWLLNFEASGWDGVRTSFKTEGGWEGGTNKERGNGKKGGRAHIYKAASSFCRLPST